MENITTGHWIFAGIFFAVFIGYLVWAYRKDLSLHRMHYNRSYYYVIVALIVVVFSFYVFKRLL